MNITIVGSGYVGLVAGACFSEVGNNITMLDSDEEKIKKLQNGIIPIYEPGLKELITNNKEKNNITFTTQKEIAYKNADIIFIAVGTPMNTDGSANMNYVKEVAKDLSQYIENYTIIVNKSTMPIGSAKMVENIINKNLKNKNATFDVVSNPEFLKEGVAIRDFMSPDRIIIGSKSQKATKIIKNLYSPFILKSNRIITMDRESAEMSKYASNALLATKISFINEMSQICEKVGANINDVRVGIGSDSRIGYSFIYPGCGYGGSCFPKDIQALSFIAKQNNVETKILDAIEYVNEYQKNLIANKIIKRFGENLDNKIFCIWGLSFKPETDDIREAPSIYLMQKLLQSNAIIQCYDPQANINMKVIFPNVKYYNNKYDAIDNADALIIMTEWKEFRNPDFKIIKDKLKNLIIFDGRNIYKDMELNEFEYYYIGGGESHYLRFYLESKLHLTNFKKGCNDEAA